MCSHYSQICDRSSRCCQDPPPIANPLPLRSIVAARPERLSDLQRDPAYDQAYTSRGRAYRIMEGQYSRRVDVRFVQCDPVHYVSHSHSGPAEGFWRQQTSCGRRKLHCWSKRWCCCYDCNISSRPPTDSIRGARYREGVCISSSFYPGYRSQ